MKGVQCAKHLYLAKHYPQLRDPLMPDRRARFAAGNKIGKLAQGLFPNGVDATPAKRFDFAESIESTKKFIQAGKEVIYEAAFIHEQVLVLLDILVKRKGKWYAYEVKSGTRITPTYLTDAALQYWVITGNGVELEDISLVHVNKEYVKKEKLNVQKLFKKSSVLHKVQQRQDATDEEIDDWKNRTLVLQAKLREAGISV